MVAKLVVKFREAQILRETTMETRWCRVYFQTIHEEIGWRYSRTAAMGKTKTSFSNIICPRCCTRRNLCFRFETITTRWSKTAHAMIGLKSRHRINPPPTRYAPGKATVNVDNGPEDIRWIRGLGSENFPAASYALLPPTWKKVHFFAIGEGSRFFRRFLHSSA